MDEILNRSLSEKKAYLAGSLSTEMDRLRRGGKKKSQAEIASKIRREGEEFAEELEKLLQKRRSRSLKLSLLSELCDLVYYALEWEEGESLWPQLEELAMALGLSPDQMVDCALVKYSFRIGRDKKDIAGEVERLKDYLTGQKLRSMQLQQVQKIWEKLKNGLG